MCKSWLEEGYEESLLQSCDECDNDPSGDSDISESDGESSDNRNENDNANRATLLSVYFLNTYGC